MEKTEWKTGDVITAEKLNNMESGIVNASGGVFTVNIDARQDENENLTVTSVDKTYEQIKQTVSNGKYVVFLFNVSVVIRGSVVTSFSLQTSSAQFSVNSITSHLFIKWQGAGEIADYRFLMDENNNTELSVFTYNTTT